MHKPASDSTVTKHTMRKTAPTMTAFIFTSRSMGTVCTYVWCVCVCASDCVCVCASVFVSVCVHFYVQVRMCGVCVHS